MDEVGWEPFAWAEDLGGGIDGGIDGMSIAVIRPAIDDPATTFSVVERLLPDRTVLEAVDAAFQLDDFAWGSEITLIDQLGDWTIAIQPIGYGTSLPDEIARVSAGGEAASVFWNVMARVTGVVIERDWLLAPRRPTYRVRIPQSGYELDEVASRVRRERPSSRSYPS